MRETKYELLRITSMVMIVAHHFMCHGFDNAALPDGVHTGGKVTCAFLLYGVNLFLLISGYFRIKLKWGSILGLLFICSFYKVFHLFWDTFVMGIPHPISDWILKPLFVLSHPGGWFLEVYIQLMLISLLINKGLDNLSDREHLVVMAGLSVINLYFGFVMRQSVNTWGYDLMQFVYMYAIGDAIRRYGLYERFGKRLWTGVYILSSLTIAALYMMFERAGLEWKEYIFGRNNPLIVVGAIAIFCAFCRMRISNRLVNAAAASMLAVYLISDGGNLRALLYGYVRDLFTNNSLVIATGISLLIMAGVFIFTIAIDRVRIMVWEKMSAKVIPTLRRGIGNVKEVATERWSINR